MIKIIFKFKFVDCRISFSDGKPKFYDLNVDWHNSSGAWLMRILNIQGDEKNALGTLITFINLCWNIDWK